MASAEDYAGWIVSNADKKGSPEFEKVAAAYQLARLSSPTGSAEDTAPLKIGKEAFPDTLRQVLRDANWGTRNIAAAGTAVTNLWEGVKQFAGQQNNDTIANNRIIRDEAPAGAFAGDVALTALPFSAAGNSIKAAAAVGAGYGATLPVENATGWQDVAKGKALNTAVGGATGAGGQWVSNKATAGLSAMQQQVAKKNLQSTPIRQTIKEAVEAGYVIPPGNVNPSFVNRQLESAGGKIATQQMAAAKNQSVTDALARKAASLADDAPITPQSLQSARDVIKKPYQDIANLGMQKHLDDLDALRSEANAAWREYSRQGTRQAINDYKQFSSQAKMLEGQIESQLKALGKSDLMQAFRDARVALAKNHDVESALIEGGGKVDATAIARMFQRGDKMTGELKTIGAFANNFRNIAKPLSGTPDAHNLRSLASLLLASGGGAMGGFPGMALGAIPMAAGPASRSIMFSQAVQRGLLAPQTVSPAARMGSGLLGYAPIGGTVLGLNALNQ